MYIIYEIYTRVTIGFPDDSCYTSGETDDFYIYIYARDFVVLYIIVLYIYTHTYTSCCAIAARRVSATTLWGKCFLYAILNAYTDTPCIREEKKKLLYIERVTIDTYIYTGRVWI